MTHEQLEMRLRELIAQRDEFVTYANARINFLNGGIEELQRLLAPPVDTPAEKPQEERK